ncbi:MAG TPA: bifunctional hydroxymethylpyrimidine kinase/phosphomethylpyrimidine kinase [Paenirhodobacter sp.]
MIPNVLSIAGSDPSGGAGIQADIKAISANGGYAMAVLTGLTAQNTQGVQAVQLIDPAMISAQIAAIRADIRIDAIKIGMLGSAQIILTVVAALEGLTVPVIVDPVMVAKGGDRLLATDAVSALRTHLLPRAQVITPNLPEAADLLALPLARSRQEMETQARALLTFSPGAVLLKGGHLSDHDTPDLLLTPQGPHWFEGPRHPTRNTHGTGCTLSATLATLLGRGLPLPKAVEAAKTYVAGAIAAADRLNVGHGHGPTHHFHALW